MEDKQNAADSATSAGAGPTTRGPRLNVPEMHRELTGHGYSMEVLTGRWKCNRCGMHGKVRSK